MHPRINRQFNSGICLVILSVFFFSLPLVGAVAPVLEKLSPPGAQRGTAFTLNLIGHNLQDVQVISTLPGSFTPLTNFAKSDRTEKQDKILFLVELPKEIPIGVYPLRVRSEQGLSNALLFSVGVLPEISEKESQQPIHQSTNNSPEDSQSIKTPVTVNGTLSGPDRDFYRIQGKRGQRLVMEVEARRTGSAIDPVLRLLNSASRQIAISNDAHGLGVDSRLDMVFPKTDTYYLMVHDARFSQQEQNFYRLKIGAFSYLHSIFPLGGQRGQKVDVELVRDKKTKAERLTVDLSSIKPKIDFTTLNLPIDAGSLPLLFAVGDLPEVIEPIGEVDFVLNPSTVFNGRISKPGEVDRYRLKVKPGEHWIIRLQAGGLGTSRLYGRLTVFDDNGRRLGSAGDEVPETQVFSAVLRGVRKSSDPFLRVQVPEGVQELLITVEDLVKRGGQTFGYRLWGQPRAADFDLTLVTPYVNIPVNGTAGVTVNVQRYGYLGNIQLSIPNAGNDLVVKGGIVPSSSIRQGDRAVSSTGMLTITAKERALVRTGELSVWGEAMLEDGTRLRRRARGPGLITKVQSSIGTGRPDPNNRDEQAPFEAHWLGMELPMMVTKKSVGKLLVTGPSYIRLVQGMDYDLFWKFKSSLPRVRPPATVSLLSLGAREVSSRPGNARAKFLKEGMFSIVTTVGTPASVFNVVLSGDLNIDGTLVSLHSSALTVEVVQGYKLVLPKGGIFLNPGKTGELVGKIERDPLFKEPVTISPENFPLGVSCAPVKVPVGVEEFRLVCKAEASATPGNYEIGIASSSVLAAREKEQVPYRIPPSRCKIVISSVKETAHMIEFKR